MLIRLGHSSDPDDAFMFWALAENRIDTRGFEFEHVLRDIQTLNEWALEGRLEVTAISLHAYPFVQDRYALLPHGASMGSGYGPVVVAGEPMTQGRAARSGDRGAGDDDDRVPRPAHVPRRLLPTGSCPFDEILDEVKSGAAEAGLLIHEGQLTYEAEGLKKVVDLGEWWLLETGLPLPLGANVARRDIGEDRLHDLSEVLAESIAAGLANRAGGDAVRARGSAAGSTRSSATGSSAMYVNELTQDYGEEGREAVRELMRRGEAIGAFESPVNVDFVS